MLKKYCKLGINYIVYFPENVRENMPLLLFLHGIGERGEKIEDIEKYALPKYMNKFDISYIVVAPQCSYNNFWDYHLKDVEKILKKVSTDLLFFSVCTYKSTAFWQYYDFRDKEAAGNISGKFFSDRFFLLHLISTYSQVPFSLGGKNS